MRRTTATLIALSMLAASGLAAQQTAQERARQTLPPEIYENLSALADDLSQAGIPDEPLFNKALEGMAKRVPPERLLPAIRAYAGRLADEGAG